MKKLSGIIVLLLAGAALYLALKTSPIDPLAWDAPAAPQMTGVLEPNDTLMKAELLGQGQLHGPEDTAVDSQGRVYAGLADGRVVRLDASGKVETFVDTGGRPLGMDFDAAGNLILADAWKGLLRIDPQGKVETLATEADGVPFAFTDDLDIASDGRIYEDFSAQLPQGAISSAIELRHVRFDEKLDATFAGVRFSEMSGLAQRQVDRFVYQLQREARRFEKDELF